VENLPQDLSFVDDPFPNSNPPSDGSGNSSGPVLQVDYPANGFGSTESGAQFYSLFNSSIPFQSMLLSYELAFDNNFDWVLGGKLPGMSQATMFWGSNQVMHKESVEVPIRMVALEGANLMERIASVQG
jgi:hypothetical protein